MYFSATTDKFAISDTAHDAFSSVDGLCPFGRFSAFSVKTVNPRARSKAP